jgi:DNA-binding NtrC family response regulator
VFHSRPGSELEPTALADFGRYNLIGESGPFLSALSLIRKVSVSDATVLIHGETGTGKELAARAIHYLGSRRDAPFIPVNCGAVPDSLIENEFFGHARGAFTDARESRAGVIEQAEGGTLFLDELEVLSPRGQVVLLRFLQDHVYRPVGGGAARRANVRVLGSSNADLAALVEQRHYRSDLLYRLSVLTLKLPPLRERAGDAVLLAQRFVQKYSALYGTPPQELDEESFAYLDAHQWPGNVRELENLVHRAVVIGDAPRLSLRAAAAAVEPGDPSPGPLRQKFRQAKAHAIAEFERAYVTDLMRRTRGNISLAARLCGKERSRLGKLLKKHGLERVAFTSVTTEP